MKYYVIKYCNDLSIIDIDILGIYNSRNLAHEDILEDVKKVYQTLSKVQLQTILNETPGYYRYMYEPEPGYDDENDPLSLNAVLDLAKEDLDDCKCLTYSYKVIKK